MQSRRSDRKEVSFPATVSVGGRKVRDVVSNVSPNGLYLEADRHRFRSGDRVRISFSLPVSGRLVPVSVEGRIARVVRDSLHRTKGIGVELTSPPKAAMETIEAYLAARDEALAGGKRAPGGEGEREQRDNPYDEACAGPMDARLAAEGGADYRLNEEGEEDVTDPAGWNPFER